MLSDRYIGLDISEQSVDLLVLDAQGAVKACVSTPCPEGMLENGELKEPDVLTEILTDSIARAELDTSDTEHTTVPVFASIPESALYVHYFTVPSDVSNDTISSFLLDAISEIIPVGIEDIVWKHKVSTREHVQYATVVGTKRDTLDPYVAALRKADMEPQYLSSSFFGLGHLLFKDSETVTTMVVDIGEQTTHVGIFDIDDIADVTIQILLGLKKDIDHTQKDFCELFVGELQEAKDYFEGTFNTEIEQIIMVGAHAVVSELLTETQEQMGVPAKQADILVHVKGIESVCKNADTTALSRVTGLAKLAIIGNTSELNMVDHLANKEQNTRSFRYAGSSVDLRIKKIISSSLTRIRPLWVRVASVVRAATHAGGSRKLLMTALVAGISLSVLVYVLIAYV